MLISPYVFAQEKDSLTQAEKERRERNIQAGNPFKEYGYTPKIATLSKGKYLEWHDLDSIIVIGSVIYNTKTNKIMDFAEVDKTDPYRRPTDETRGRWISPDPLSEEAPSWTPYRFGFNNPIYFNDPTGLFEDDYQLHDDGSVTLLQKTDDTFDTLYASNADGSVDKNTSVTVDKAKASDSSVIGDLANVTPSNDSDFPKGIRSANTSNSKDAFDVFVFVAKNSNVEWGMNGYFKNGKESFDIFTGHNKALTPGPGGMAGDNLKYLNFSIHSHKNNNFVSDAQVYYSNTRDDYTAASTLIQAYKNAGGRSSPSFFMLFAPTNGSMNLHKYWVGTDNKGNFGGDTRNLGTVSTLNVNILNK